MNTERIREIQNETACPLSRSVRQALLKVWNECEQERKYSEEDMHNLMEEYQDYLFKTNSPLKTFKEWFEQFKKK